MHFLIYRDERKEYRWALVAKNDRTLADSGEGYKSKSYCKKIVAKIKATIGNAPLIEE